MAQAALRHEALDPAFEALIDLEAPVSQIGSGFIFTEGPIWHPVSQHLLFSDMPGDVRRRWDGRSVRDDMRPSNKGNGMTFDAALNLLVCEHATSAVARFRPGGRREVLATHFQGRELNSPNDICVKSDGSIWFTDPTYGRLPHFGVERPTELGFQGVYRLAADHTPGREPSLVVDRYLFTQPNGLCFSPDERLLYVNDTVQTNIRVFEVLEDGRLGPGRVFASGIVDPLREGVPDGMKCDVQGNVWLTAPAGLWVYAPSGKLIGKVAIPEKTANLHWGGRDWRTLFVCATSSVYAVPTKIGPRVEPFMQSGPAAAAARGDAASASETAAATSSGDALRIDPFRTALVIQDMQNDVVMEGGAFADSGAPAHCREQNAIANTVRLAEACRARGVAVIHVWFLVEPGAPGLTLNAPLFHGVKGSNALVKDSWGGAPAPGLEPQEGDFVVVKNRMSPWEVTPLETILKAAHRDTLINTGAWTNMSVEHTARTGADRGYRIILPEDCCATMNADWHNASINYALQNVSTVTTADAVIAAMA